MYLPKYHDIVCKRSTKHVNTIGKEAIDIPESWSDTQDNTSNKWNNSYVQQTLLSVQPKEYFKQKYWYHQVNK